MGNGKMISLLSVFVVVRKRQYNQTEIVEHLVYSN